MHRIRANQENHKVASAYSLPDLGIEVLGWREAFTVEEHGVTGIY
jgi:hypothetical protein